MIRNLARRENLKEKEVNMKLRFSVIILSVIVALMVTVAPQVEAGYMGHTIDWQYYAYGGPYSFSGGTTSGSFTADGTVGASFIDGTSYSFFDITVNDTQIIFDYLSMTGTWTSSDNSYSSGGMTIDNGILISSIDALIPDITSVSVDALTNMAGFDMSKVTFDTRNIAIDWENLAFTPDTRVVLNVFEATSVPEPATLILLGSGLLGLAVARRKIKK